MTNNNSIVLVAAFVAKDGKAEELRQAMEALLEPTRSEAGCIYYKLHRNVDNLNEFTMLEKFKDHAAFEFHSNQPYVQHFLNRTVKDLVASSLVKFYHEV